MSDSFSSDIEAGLGPEKDIRGAELDDGIFDVGGSSEGLLPGPSPGDSKSVGVSHTAVPVSGDTSEKAGDLYPTQPGEQQTNVISESWKGSAESILLFAGLFSMTISPFVIESYNRLSPDVADQANAIFDQVAHLVGISGGIVSLDSPPPPLGLDAASFEPSPSVVRATTLWLLSLGLNVACVLYVLCQQGWGRWIDPPKESDEPRAHVRVLAYLFSRVGRGRFGMAHMAGVIWALLHSSALLFLVGLVDYIIPISITITWLLLGYLALLASLHVAMTLLPNRFPSLVLSPNSM